MDTNTYLATTVLGAEEILMSANSPFEYKTASGLFIETKTSKQIDGTENISFKISKDEKSKHNSCYVFCLFAGNDYAAERLDETKWNYYPSLVSSIDASAIKENAVDISKFLDLHKNKACSKEVSGIVKILLNS